MEEEQNINLEGQEQGFKKDSNIRRYFYVVWDFLQIIIIAALIVLPIRYFIFQPFIVKGESMVPNLHSGDYLIIDEISYRFSEPKRGDVVVFKYPLDESQRFVKRIIGLPGETVEVRDGKIKISKDENEIILDEVNYLPDLLSTEGNKKMTLAPGEYFVMGDNRQFSYDSRSWGSLPEGYMIGKAVFRLFPIKGITYISNPGY